eukprot:2324342-Amphidinium_carterae.2
MQYRPIIKTQDFVPKKEPGHTYCQDRRFCNKQFLYKMMLQTFDRALLLGGEPNGGDGDDGDGLVFSDSSSPASAMHDPY